ncbi:MAG: hypothetical protein ABI680_05835, partial [Chthoniobacteraceae bacterium]
MIGETYFQTRAQLGTTVFSLQTLASECHASSATILALERLQIALREPFCFIALGSAKSGKSTLFNALFGRELCRCDNVDDGPRIRVLKYGDEEREVVGNGMILECFRPAIFLREFSLVEATIGDGSTSVQALLETDFIPRADLIFYLFSVSDPWAADTWQALARLDRATMNRVVIILQQCDRRSASEVEAIAREIEQTLEESVGQTRPVFAVSAQKAFETRRHQREVEDTGFRRLERFIDDEVTASPTRCEGFSHVRQTAQEVLRELGRDNGAGLARIERDATSVKQLTHALRTRHDESFRQIAGILWTLTHACEAAQRQADKELARTLNLAGLARLLIRRRPAWPGEFQRGVERQLHETTARQVESSVRLLGAALRADGQHLQAGIEKYFDANLRGALNVPDFQTPAALILKRLRSVLDPAPSPSENEQPWLASTLASAGAWLWLPVITVLAITGFAIYAALEKSVFKELAIAAAATAAMALLGVALVVQTRVQLGFRRHMVETREHSINR